MFYPLLSKEKIEFFINKSLQSLTVCNVNPSRITDTGDVVWIPSVCKISIIVKRIVIIIANSIFQITEKRKVNMTTVWTVCLYIERYIYFDLMLFSLLSSSSDDHQCNVEEDGLFFLAYRKDIVGWWWEKKKENIFSLPSVYRTC